MTDDTSVPSCANEMDDIIEILSKLRKADQNQGVYDVIKRHNSVQHIEDYVMKIPNLVDPFIEALEALNIPKESKEEYAKLLVVTKRALFHALRLSKVRARLKGSCDAA